ncbi:Thymus-specific serine protease [Pseudolycoriella hygida]|uniref:Thymus-specific serine protease n=1 Tax=Pseudolycoriella hygida TaxID=35572 RepID=A0A9Q0S213_9DIPT|nr:Thymus-specific serine protease [Pseudolycoriella hygida]
MSITGDAIKTKLLQDVKSGEHANVDSKAFYLSKAVLNDNEWFLDSATSFHMSPRADWMKNPLNKPIDHIVAANNEKLKVKAAGVVEVNVSIDGVENEISIRNVLHVPDLSSNLLSISQLCQKGHTVIFRNEGCQIFDAGMNLTATGRHVNNMFLLNVSNNCCLFTADVSEMLLWHRRLGHLNRNDLCKLKCIADGIDFSSTKSSEPCIDCLKEDLEGESMSCVISLLRVFVGIASEIDTKFGVTTLSTAAVSGGICDASVENMRFLNIEQALADLAHFITYIRRSNPEFVDSQIIMVGGSYSATMVAWFRQKYPHLTAGAWASSAPVFVKVDYFEYKEVVGASIRSVGGEECFQRLARAFDQAEQLFANRNFAEFSRTFRTCDEMNDEDPYDIQIMFYTLSELLAGLVQGHRTGDIEGFCSVLLDPTVPDESDLQAFTRWYIRRVFGSNPSPDDCADSTFESNVMIHRNATWGSAGTASSMRQWFFQTCNEFGWYETSESRFQPFGSRFPVGKFHAWCRDVYGDEFTAELIQANTERKNAMYGGFNPNVNNVYFTNGLIDPWRIMGIQNDVNERSPADVIPDASHCNDLSSNSPTDSPRMLEVRERILQLVRLWIGLVG